MAWAYKGFICINCNHPVLGKKVKIYLDNKQIGNTDWHRLEEHANLDARRSIDAGWYDIYKKKPSLLETRPKKKLGLFFK